MKKLFVLMISLLMMTTLIACSSSKEENTRSIKSVSFFGKEYSTPIKLDDLIKDGVEPTVVFMDKVSSNDVQNVYLSKNGENIRVTVYNPTKESLSVTDPQLVVSYFCLQYKDSYLNAAEIPDMKLAGVSVGDDGSKLISTFGEPVIQEVEDGIGLKHWSWDDGCGINVTEIVSSVYAIEAWLPKE